MKQITIRCTEEEHQQLLSYCKHKGRSQNEVIREQIRKLSISAGA
ncbi:MAG: CopG family transcriptional regulator [Cyanobacteria bacterium SW_9_44_58]|nr:MAG: CopG family transcriptional regulator [Cyanobacteria bacterium SW_9_44_58]